MENASAVAARRRRRCVVFACLIFSATATRASTSDTAPSADSAPAAADVQSLDKDQTEQERLRALIDGAPKAYQDKFMAATEVAAQDEENPAAEDEGLRSYFFELGAGYDQLNATGYGDRSAGQFGLRSGYRVDTLNYGDFLFQADLRNRSGDPLLGGSGAYGYSTQATSGRILLQSVALPLTDRIFADTSLGDMMSEVTDAFARTYRLALGSDYVRGLSTHIYSADFDLRAGSGERGFMIGSPYPGFEKSEGTLSWFGYTQRFDDDRFAGLQVDRASGVNSYFDNVFATTAPTSTPKNLLDVTSWAATVGFGYTNNPFQATPLQGRAILVGSRTEASSSTPTADIASAQTSGDAKGLFLEGNWRSGNYTHQFGAYTTDPNLYFGDYQLTTGDRGAYWHVDHSGTRLGWGVGVDYEKSTPFLDATTNTVDIASRRLGINANAQYQFDRYTTLGASINVADNRFDAQTSTSPTDGSRSIYANVFYQTRFFDWPLSRFNLNLQRNDQILIDSAAATGEELQWEQQWIGGRYETLHPELTTTLGIAHDQSGGQARNYPTAGVQFRYWLDADFNINGSLQYSAQDGGLSTTHGLSGTLGLERGFARHWRFGASASINQARASVQQNSLTAPLLSRSDEKLVYLYLRWEGQSGSGFHVAGMPTGSPGTGRISGVVFEDANHDGLQQGDERGVSGVEVILDGRYRTRTDAQGRFEFPQTATGSHRLGVNVETVPLPWGVAREETLSTDVPLRGQAMLNIPVVKVSE